MSYKKTPEPAPLHSADQKIADLEQKIKDLEKQLAETKNSYLRTYADLENYKKRVAKEKEELIQANTEGLLREILDVKDHLEMAVDHAKDATDVKPLYDGVTLTLKQMQQYLEKFGVTEMTALGESFNPAFHEAIFEEESVEFRPGSVAKEFQKGYLYNGRLLRAARVAVAKEKKS